MQTQPSGVRGGCELASWTGTPPNTQQHINHHQHHINNVGQGQGRTRKEGEEV
eukprot:COSAG04_NODE_7301_length_1151_cov_0.963878_1_plen_52_part_10